jgi:hypothetical protein
MIAEAAVRGGASVAVIDAGQAMKATNPGKLGEAVGEVTERCAGRNGDQPECSNGDPRARVEPVQNEHESSDGHRRDYP